MPQADTTVTLGGVTFAGFEIPASIPWGGAQSLAIHKLVCGQRVIDAMGRDDRPLAWSGLFFGSNAVTRARALDALRIGGAPQTLTWNAFNYSVVIEEFEADFRRQYEIPYRISCVVVADNVSPVSTSSVVSTDDAVNADLGSANTLAASVGNSTLTTLMSTLSTAVAAVSTFAGASASVIAGVLSPLNAAQGQVTSLIATEDTAIGAAAGFAGVTAGGYAPTLAAALEATEAAAEAEYGLWILAGLLGRMAANLNALNGSPNVLAVAGGNLFQIAASEYGDADDWTAIAAANNLTDPFIQGAVTLTIPLQPSDSGGILSS